MTGRQIDKLTMLLVVSSVLKSTNATIIVQMPHMASLIEELDQHIDAINENYRTQTSNTKGIRMQKLTLRGELTALILEVAARMEAYTISINNKVLQKEIEQREYKIKKMREHTVTDLGNYIHERATALQAELAPFGVIPTLLTDLQEATIEYGIMVPKTRGAIVNKAISTKTIKQLLENVDRLIKRIDGLVTMLRFSEKEFYTQYFNSRKIITRGVRKNALHGQIKGEQGETLSGVTVTILANTTIETQSGEKGNYLFRRLPEGVWPVTFSKLGYVSETIYLAIVPNSPHELSLQLKKQDLKMQA